MPFLTSSIPYFKAWVRREYTKNLEEYHGEFLHCMVIGVTTMPNRTLSFQVLFTGCESDFDDSENIHGGAMWARLPITALVADDPAQHKQSHVLELLDAGEYTGNIVALPNNRVRVTHPAWFETGQGAPDFKPNQHTYNSKEDVDYIWDTQRVFNNLYSEEEQ